MGCSGAWLGLPLLLLVRSSVSPATVGADGLTGTLPAAFFKWHPHLQRLQVGRQWQVFVCE